MKKIIKTSFFVFSFLALFYSNAFAFIEFKQSKDISSDADGLRQINFKPDGTIMYVTNREKDTTSTTDSVIQYSLSTPFDINTATKTSSTPLTNIDKPHAIKFKPDGKVMYVIDNAELSVRQYNLTTAWDTSTLQYDDDFNVSDENQLRSLAFKTDGTKMYVTGNQTEVIQQFTLSTPWDVKTATKDSTQSSALTSKESNPRSIQFHSSGTIFYIGGNGSDSIHKYTLTTPWDVSTLEFSQSYSFSDQVSSSGNSIMAGFIFSANFTKLYITQDTDSRQSQTGTNTIFEYSVACAGTITCADASANDDVKAIIEANVELSKRIIKNNTLPIFHRIEWLRRHKNKDNLSNLNAEIDFTNEKISKLVSALKNSKKEIDRSYDSEDWFKWSEGRISLGKNKSINSSSRDFHSYGISVGADKIKDDDRDAMHGYVFQYANDNVDIGSSGTKLETDAYSFALYDTKLRDDHFFTDALIGISLLDIDQKRVIYGNTLEGNREGQQIYGSFNFGKRIVDEDLNLNPGLKLDLGYTKLKAFRERTIAGDSLADALLYKEQNIKSALITLGVLLDKTDTDKEEDEIINHHGRLEYIADLSPSSDAEFYYLNSQSTVYNYNVENKSKHNLRIGYGFDVTSITGWSFVGNFERFQSNGKGHSNEIYLSVGYVPIDEMKFVFDLNNFENTSFSYTNNINGFDLKMSSNYNFISDVPDYGANIEISNKF
ncbi:autotransporter domain-containing protein [Candidatus Pelagibacter sp.]|nr:autotransporter domain-containing protein [Candidatus Pelagibacter bacterium]MDC0397778.1 autotransporter domain-containing protein [Candidatus Pelagibacter sp.]MDC0901106.1 autotransporter domain-containing protein [Candidatus Pelagibacter sp.]MDC0922145.1 autotransporter domain-containing protein [Candidatus Pelagibacter sp.]MDC1069602.1 autotransporter domain-containing protein [Candidatus Pelagibacter sp.]